jgi:hypothetical protein
MVETVNTEKPKPNMDALSTQLSTMVQGAELISVTNREEYAAICKQEDVAVGLRKQVTDYFDPDVKKAHELHKSLTAKRKAFLDPIDAFLTTVKRIQSGYLEKERREEQARLEVIRKQAEEIRRKQEAELAAQAEALRIQQEEERKRKEEEFKNSPEELARQAELLRVRQAEEQAALRREAEARMVDASAIPANAPKADAGAGRASVTRYTFEIVEEAQIPREYFTLDTSKLQKVITALKEKANIPGVRVVEESSVRRTGK